MFDGGKNNKERRNVTDLNVMWSVQYDTYIYDILDIICLGKGLEKRERHFVCVANWLPNCGPLERVSHVSGRETGDDQKFAHRLSYEFFSSIFGPVFSCNWLARVFVYSKYEMSFYFSLWTLICLGSHLRLPASSDDQAISLAALRESDKCSGQESTPAWEKLVENRRKTDESESK